MFDRTIRLLGNASLALLVPCLVLALASLPTVALADGPDPTQCVEGQTYVPIEGGGGSACCPNEWIVYNNGAAECRVQCNLHSGYCNNRWIFLGLCNGGCSLFRYCGCSLNPNIPFCPCL